MPQVHFVKKARKSNKKLGIVRGLPYWWWTGPKPRVHGKRGRRIVSLSPPRPSQVTSNPYLKRCLTIKESVEAAGANGRLRSTMDEASLNFAEIAVECADKANAMPRSLQDSPVAETLRQRSLLCIALSEALKAAENSSDISWEF